jgi:CshA-type fibril repeat protein
MTRHPSIPIAILALALAASPFLAPPAAAQEPVFTETVGFATKTGFRGVFAWQATAPVVGVVHYGTNPDALDQSAQAIPGAPDTAGLAVAPLLAGETYYFQVEDQLTGVRSAVGSFEAKNAYNDWNGSVYTLDLLVALDTQSLPEDIPSDQALADIAAGINVFAERLYDALDGYARLGTVLITDTNLDWAGNIPFFAPACVEEVGSVADVLIQTTIPFDSHTWGGWSIDHPCIAFYVGRIGQLVVPWENDLHFGYVSTHEMMHYAFNAPDLYGEATVEEPNPADCRNLAWDGSLMHNTGGWAGKWELTELDRNPTLTPCQHGSLPWTWDALRERYTEVPLNPDGPIDHMFDDLARGNADGDALQILILDREPAASTLTPYTPDDQLPTCGNQLPPLTDAQGDATGFAVVEESAGPSEPSLDVLAGYLTWDADAEAVTFHIVVDDLTDAPPVGALGHFFRFAFHYGNAAYTLIAARDPLGEEFSLRDDANATIASGLAGEFDAAEDEIRITISSAELMAADPAAPPFAEGEVIDGFEVLAQRYVGVLTLTADIGRGTCSYRIGQERLQPNQPPVAVADQAETAEDSAVSIAVLANDSDPDGDALAVQSTSSPRGGTAAKGSGGTVTFTPAADFHGEGGFTYTVTDGLGGTASADVTVTVTPLPDPPRAADDTAATLPGQPVVIDVLANDNDPDGDALTVSAVTQGSAGTVTHDGSQVTYTPGGAFTETDSFTYTASDATGNTASATVTVFRSDCVTSWSDDLEPAPEPGWAFTNANGGLVTATTWAHTLDPAASSPTHSFFSDASDLSASKDDRVIAPPQEVTPLTRLSFQHRFRTEERFDGGVLEVSIDGGATWSDVTAAGGVFLAGGYNGTANAFGGRAAWQGASAPTMTEVTVDLGALAGETALVRWRLRTDTNLGDLGWWIDDVAFTNVAAASCEPTNRAPVAAADEAETQAGEPVVIAVLANDSDPDGDPLTVAEVGAPAHGTATTDGTTVTYTPADGFAGTDAFSYTVSDGNGGSDTGQVTVSVNGPPVADDDAATTPEDQAVTIEVLANDSDPNGDALTVSVSGAPAHGAATANGDGTVSYQPAPDFHGEDAFVYTVEDGRGGSDSATVRVTVTAVNDSPEAVDDTATTPENRPISIDVLANDSDADGDALEVASVSPSPDGSVKINPEGTVRFRPDPHFTGQATFTYTVEDGNGGATTATVTVTVTPR